MPLTVFLLRHIIAAQLKLILIFIFCRKAKGAETMAYDTKQGRLLQEYLAGLGGRHVSVQEIADNLPVKVGISTIYRQLERMEAQGLVRKYINDGEPACYQYIEDGTPGCHGHLHLKCSACGRLIHLECEEFDRLAEHLLREHGFRTDPLRTSIFGVCRDCLAKEQDL